MYSRVMLASPLVLPLIAAALAVPDEFEFVPAEGLSLTKTFEVVSETELRAVDIESGRKQLLFVGALQEIDVAPDGSAVAFCYGRGHVSMGLAVLRLDPPSDPDGLPRAIGEPEYVVRTEKTWHIHKSNQRNIKCITGSNKSCCLIRSINIKYS